MSLIIENIDSVNVTIDDLGIFLSPSQQYDLAQDEANAIYMSTDLPSAISGGQIRVYDPLDDVTPLSTSDALEAISLINDTHFRLKGGTLNQLDDVDTTGVTTGDFLYYNGSNFIIRDPDDVATDLFGSPQPFVRLTGDENIAGEKRFVDEIRVGGSGVADLQLTFNGPDGPAAGYAIRQVGIGSPQINPGTLFFMDNAAFPQVLMGSDSANTQAAFWDVDNDGILYLNALHTGPVVIGPGGLLPDDPNTSIGTAGDPWGLIHTNDEIRFHETAAGSPVQYVSFEAPSSITSSVTWTLPATDSTGTQALVSDGSGNLSWSSINVPQNLWETFNADSGSTTANTTTDTLTVSGGTGISTSISGDTLTITNDSPNIDQNLWETVTGDSGSTTASSTTQTLNVVGGTGISTAMSGNTLTITNTVTDTGITELTGDVTAGPGSGSQVATIANDAVTYPKIQNVVSNNVLLGNNSGAGSVVEELTASEVRTIINVEDGAAADQNIWETITADTGSTTANTTTDNLTIAGGTNITTSISGDTLTIDTNLSTDDLPSVFVGLTSNITIPTTFANINWPTTHVENNTAVVEHDNTNTDRILIKETGLYLISFNMSFDADAGEETIQGRVLIDDTTVVPGSLRVASEDDEINDLSNTFTAELTSGTYLTFQHQASGTGNLTHSSTNFCVTRAAGVKGEKGDIGPAGTQTDIPVVQARRTTTLTDIPLTWTDLDFDTTDVENDDSIIEHLNPTFQDRIEVKEDGMYELTYHLVCDDEVQGRFRVNDTTVVPGSTQIAGDPGDANDVDSLNHTKVYYSLTANDYITVQVQAATTAEDLQVDALFLVKKLQAGKGEKGDPGTGSTIMVQEDDSLIGVTDTVNFEGNVSVTAEGSPLTKATVTVPKQSHLYRHNSTTTQAFGGTPIIVNFGTNVRTDSDYTHSLVTGGSQITINTSGWYKIEYEVGIDNGNNSRSIAATGVFLNGSLVAHSLGFSYHRNSSQGVGVCFATVKLNLTATDTVDVQVALFSGGGALTTVSNSCRLNIESIDEP